MDSLVIRNNIFWKNDEAVRMLRVCDLVFEGNSFYDNGMVLTNLLSSGSACFVNNTISEAEKRIVTFQSDKSRMNGNNFLHYKKDALLFANLGSEDVDMRANYWDTEEEEVIDEMTIRPEIKEFLDSYETFMDEYVAFMQTYMSGGMENMVAMMGEYTNMLSRYEEFTEALDSMDEEAMTNAELYYYLEVTSRVSQKLLLVAGE